MAEEKKETKEKKKEKEENKDFGLDTEEMARAGLQFGHRVSSVYPKMKPYIFGVRNTVHIIDLDKTAEKLKEALEFIKKQISENKILLFVGTKIQVKDMAKEVANECNLPHITERWLGGTLTNFRTIKKRIDYFKELEEKRKKGEFDKYTKKERAKIDKEIQDLDIKFGGIKNLEKLPDIIFVLDMKKNHSAVKEAKKIGVAVIGIADTNVDPTLVDFAIPANDDAISSVKYILEKVKEVILSAKLKAQNAKPQLKT